MIKKATIIERLDELKESCKHSASITDPTTGQIITGEMKAALLDEVYSFIETYFAQDTALRSQIMYLISQVYSDYMKRNTTYSINGMRPHYSEAFPPAYLDITALFTGGGTLPDILQISEADFLASFSVTEAGAATSDKITTWVNALTAARAGELSSVETLLNFCKDSGQSNGLFVAFEEYGQAKIQKTKQDAAREIYSNRGYGDLIREFELEIYMPSYLR